MRNFRTFFRVIMLLVESIRSRFNNFSSISFFAERTHSQVRSDFIGRYMNTRTLQDLVKGRYGRKIAYTSVPEITEENVVSVLGEVIGVFNWNKPIIKYLWDYKNGDQPVLYRVKTVRDDIVNVVVENHAWEIVRFKNAQTYGEPVQYISTSKDEKVSEAVDMLNRLAKVAGKRRKDVDSGEWTSAVGTGFKAIQRTNDPDIPFRIVAPTPMNTFVIYSQETDEALAAVQELKDAEKKNYYLVFTPTHEFRIQNSQLIPLEMNADGVVIYSRLHAFGGIPIIEYPNNQSRISDIELVISMLDAVNTMQSNRMDGIEQFVQSWIKFVNCDIDEDTFTKMKMMGALVVKSNNGSENKADVDVMSQELNQSQAQVAKKDLFDNILSIEAIPNREGNTGGDTQGAVSLRNGWDFSKQAAKLKDAYIEEGDKKLAILMMNCIRITSGASANIVSALDFECQISHSPQDNMMVKAEVFKLLAEAGIHPKVAMESCGLWADSEKTYNVSKPYLDGLYKTADELEKQAEKERQSAETAQQETIREDKDEVIVDEK